MCSGRTGSSWTGHAERPGQRRDLLAVVLLGEELDEFMAVAQRGRQDIAEAGVAQVGESHRPYPVTGSKRSMREVGLAR